MPLLKCLDCMHEWEGQSDSKCDWCGFGGRILEETTAFEKAIEGFIKKISNQKDIPPKYAKLVSKHFWDLI